MLYYILLELFRCKKKKKLTIVYYIDLLLQEFLSLLRSASTLPCYYFSLSYSYFLEIFIHCINPFLSRLFARPLLHRPLFQHLSNRIFLISAHYVTRPLYSLAIFEVIDWYQFTTHSVAPY